MKKMRKVFAMLLAFAMVMGMSLTTFAAKENNDYLADITVQGLTQGETTTVNIFAAVVLDAEQDDWVVADWAAPYIVLNEDTNEYEITDAGKIALYAAPAGQETAAPAIVTDEESVTFENLPVGAYVVVASGLKTTYTTLVAETYKQDDTYMAAEDVTVVAKSSGYKLDKVVDDNFVKVGQVLNFDVTTTFPNFTNPTANSTFVIEDTPTNLVIDATSVTLKIANALVAADQYTVAVDATTGVLTVDLSNLIGTNNANAGKAVLVEYQAEVTGTTDDEEAFENVVVATRDGEKMGEDSTNGFTGEITITKTDDKETNATVLAGAEFNVFKDGSETALGFTKLDDVVVGEDDDAYTVSVYKYDKNSTQTTIVAEYGYVKVTGLDEGTYFFEETKAPAGYSINDEGVTAGIEANNAKHVLVAKTLKDTKLSSLPSTGGIGTAVFTIGGCAIMIAAAYFFFVSRKKEA